MPAYLSKKEAKLKISKYCAYQERSQAEVRDKLYSLNIYGDDAEEIISELITENFINEQRFADIYAGSKFRLKKWGKIKIKNHLIEKKVSERCIREALEKLEEADYLTTARELISGKRKSIHLEDPYQINYKIYRYMISKGYEPEVIWTILKSF